MADKTDKMEEIDILIEDYLEGRMDSSQRAVFESRINGDVALQDRVKLAAHSAKLVQQALGWLTPGDEFDDQVSSKILSITQSGQNIRPSPGSGGGVLNSKDPDAQLLEDPEAEREKKRLLVLGVIAAVLFLIAASAIGYSIIQGMQAAPAVPAENRTPENPPSK